MQLAQQVDHLETTMKTSRATLEAEIEWVRAEEKKKESATAELQEKLEHQQKDNTKARAQCAEAEAALAKAEASLASSRMESEVCAESAAAELSALRKDLGEKQTVISELQASARTQEREAAEKVAQLSAAMEKSDKALTHELDVARAEARRASIDAEALRREVDQAELRAKRAEEQHQRRLATILSMANCKQQRVRSSPST